MKKVYSSLFFTLVTLLLTFTLKAQNDKKEEIAKKVIDYFFLERENIHVHFDKKIFLTNEEIWFKGYVFHRKKNTPFFSTTNIYGSLIDSDGNVLTTQLLYGSLGSFSGSFKLDKSFKSGKYYLQFYTNWMNNFSEDESFVQEITIMNEDGPVAGLTGKPSYNNINISFLPEGGTLVKGVANNIGITVHDCNNNAMPVSEVDIVDSSGRIKKIQINKLGYGRFEIPADAGTGYKAIVTVNGVKHEQELPLAQLRGIALEVNNTSIENKVIAKLKTNTATLESFGGKPLYLIIHQDDKVTVAEINLTDKKTEQAIPILNEDLINGVNTIMIIDSDMNLLAERIIYKYPKSSVLTDIKPGKTTDSSYEVNGTMGKTGMNLSISVLPEPTISADESNDILGSFLIAPYLNGHKQIAGKYYLNKISKGRHFELDLLLLNSPPKYKWNDIKNSPPKSKYTFDIGLELKGTVNQQIKNKKDTKVKIFSYSGMVDETVGITDKNEIHLTNLILADSTKLSFSLMEKGVKKQELKLYPQIYNNVRNFNKPYKPLKITCPLSDAGVGEEPEMPKFSGKTIVLEEVKITGKTTALKHQKNFGNSQLRGYKITDTEVKSFFYILDYIRYHGFNVTNGPTGVSITGRTVNTINGQPTTPFLYINNIRQIGFDILQMVQTDDVDEIYINQHAIVPGVDNNMGMIKIYMKTDFSYRQKKGVADTSFFIKNGFQNIKPFKNAVYNSTIDKGFENFGLIDWQPLLTTDETGNLKLNIPRNSQKTVKVIIEGFGADGTLLSEIKTITLE